MASGQEAIDVQYLQLVQQLVELQKENNKLHWGNVQKRLALQPPERPIIKQGSIDSQWPLFVDLCFQYKDMFGLTNPGEI